MAALLESESADDSCAGADGAPLSARLRAHPARARRGLSRRRVHRFPGSRARDDVGAAERIREQLVEPDAVENDRATSCSCCCRRSLTASSFSAYLLAAIGRGLVVGAGVFVGDDLVRRRAARAPAVGDRARDRRQRRHGGAGRDRRHAVGQGRSALRFFQNFIILPLTFLSGVFYSIHSLPPFWQAFSHVNPIFYMIDGFRYGFFGQADVSPWLSLAIVGSSFLALSLLDSVAHPLRIQAALTAVGGVSVTCSVRCVNTSPLHSLSTQIWTRIHQAVHRTRSRVRARRSRRRRPSFRGGHREPASFAAAQGAAAPARLRARSASACARKSTRCR